MNKELEAKFLHIDKTSIRKKLLTRGAELIKPEFLMRRKTFDFADRPQQKGHYKWMRVRDEGDKITMNLKYYIEEDRIDNIDEHEIIVNDFDESCAMLVHMGLTETNYQENYRELWHLKKSEVTLDTWPGIHPIMEIEGPSEEEIVEIAVLLGFDFDDAVFGSVDIVYESQLGIPPSGMMDIKVLTFENYKKVLPKWEV